MNTKTISWLALALSVVALALSITQLVSFSGSATALPGGGGPLKVEPAGPRGNPNDPGSCSVGYYTGQTYNETYNSANSTRGVCETKRQDCQNSNPTQTCGSTFDPD